MVTLPFVDRPELPYEVHFFKCRVSQKKFPEHLKMFDFSEGVSLASPSMCLEGGFRALLLHNRSSDLCPHAYVIQS